MVRISSLMSWFISGSSEGFMVSNQGFKLGLAFPMRCLTSSRRARDPVGAAPRAPRALAAAGNLETNGTLENTDPKFQVIVFRWFVADAHLLRLGPYPHTRACWDTCRQARPQAGTQLKHDDNIKQDGRLSLGRVPIHLHRFK